MRPTLDSLKQSLKASSLVLLGLAALGCEGGASAPSDDVTPPEDSDLVPASPGGKTDTGYLSTLAFELEGTFESEMRIDLRDKTPEEREARDVLRRLQSAQSDGLTAFGDKMPALVRGSPQNLCSLALPL